MPETVDFNSIVMDRRAAFYYWIDQQSLEQAIFLAKFQEIVFREVAEWSEAVGISVEYKILRGL